MDERVPLLPRLFRAVANLLNGLGSVGAAVVRPLEYGLGVVIGRLVSWYDRLENVDLLFHTVFRALVFVYVRFSQLLKASTRLLLPDSVRSALGAVSHGASWLIGFLSGAVVRLAERLNIDDALFFMVHLLKPVWYPFAAVGLFCTAWLATRSYKKLLWCIPPTLLIVPILLATVWCSVFGKATIAEQYRASLSRSLETKDYSHAQLLERKLASLGYEVPFSLFNNALLLEKQGKVSEAYERMQALASAEEPGYPPAHGWIAQHLLLKELNLPSAEAHRLAGKHLQQLTTLSIKGPLIDMMRASWLIDENKLAEAADLLKPLVHTNSSAATERFRIDLQLDQREQARADAHEVCEHMKRLEKSGNPISSRDYESWAAAEECLEHRAELRKIAEEWAANYADSMSARKRVAAVCAQEFNEILSATPADPKALSERLRTLVDFALPSDNVRGRVAVLYKERKSRPEINKMFDFLDASENKSSALAEALGTAATVTAEWSRAQKYLEESVRKDATNAIAWNNLACVLLEKDNASLEQALAAANKALAVKPDDYKFRETRGEALARLGRSQEAVDDLEYAINGMPESAVVHSFLYKAYMQLGKNDLAAVHAQYATK